MRYLATILMIFMLSGCASESFKFTSAYSLDLEPPPGPPEYTKAWKDGCETGVAANTNDFYKFYTRVRQDPELVKSELYRRVWTDAYNYCWFFTETTLSYSY